VNNPRFKELFLRAANQLTAEESRELQDELGRRLELALRVFGEFDVETYPERKTAARAEYARRLSLLQREAAPETATPREPK
jgi:hypothetical protein